MGVVVTKGVAAVGMVTQDTQTEATNNNKSIINLEYTHHSNNLVC